MKPVKKDGKRQQRRERTLARLEATLKGGVKLPVTKKEIGSGKFKKVTKTFGSAPVPFEQIDIDRIKGEIATLKTRLGRI